MKILLANDTGIIDHVGCLSVSDAHARLLGRAGHRVTRRIFVKDLAFIHGESDDELVAALARRERLVSDVANADAIIVNGEGTIHHGAGRQLLALLSLGQRKRKATLLINAVFEQTAGFQNTLEQLDHFTVRESRSAAHARERGLNPLIVPDSALAANFMPAAARLTGWVTTDAHPNRPDSSQFLESFRSRHTSTHLPLVGAGLRQSWRTWPSMLSTAQALVTGRHHGIYMAILAGIPFVAVSSNSHKIEGMLDMLGCPELLVSAATGFEEITRLVERQREVSMTHRQRLGEMFGAGPLTMLGCGHDSTEEQEIMSLERQVAERLAAGPDHEV